MVETIRYCAECRQDRVFEQPHPVAGACPDAADGCCPEWCCTGCGAAMLIGFTPHPARPAYARQPARRVA
jgi:hypothetical protein